MALNQPLRLHFQDVVCVCGWDSIKVSERGRSGGGGKGKGRERWCADWIYLGLLMSALGRVFLYVCISPGGAIDVCVLSGRV